MKTEHWRFGRSALALGLISLIALGSATPGVNAFADEETKRTPLAGEQGGPPLGIRALKILTVTKGVIDNGLILIRDGMIAAVGTHVAAPGDTVFIDATDQWVLPGMIDLHSHIGTAGRDINDMALPTNPDLRILEALDPRSPELKDALTGGVTTILVIPGSGTNISGFGALIKTAGDTLEDLVVRSPGAMKVAQGYNPERLGGDLGLTRMGMSWGLTHLLDEGKDYTDAWDAYEAGNVEDAPEFRPELEQLKGLFRKEYPVIIHTAGARDVMSTIRMFNDRYKLWTIISHATFNGYRVAHEAAKRGMNINLGPRQIDFRFAAKGTFIGLGAEYYKAGVENLSINTDAPVVPQEDLFVQAAMAVRYGLDERAAIAAVTIRGAEAVGIADRVGSIEVGKEADIVIRGGHPLDPRSSVDAVFIKGRLVYRRADWEPSEGASLIETIPTR
ncbi:MAG: amidohydrolase family protein [Planctomycetota bacterium]|nr:amidohydrolase family protein [Planctomycetota bacterium]